MIMDFLNLDSGMDERHRVTIAGAKVDAIFHVHFTLKNPIAGFSDDSIIQMGYKVQHGIRWEEPSTGSSIGMLY